MIILIAGMRRSGSTVAYQIACKLTGRSMPKFFDLYEFALADNQNWWAGKTHNYWPEMVPYVKAGKIRVITIVRDPRDIVVSIMNFNRVDFHEAMESRLLQDSIHHQIGWENSGIPILGLLKYEDFAFNEGYLVKNIAAACGYKMYDGDIDRVAREFSIHKNKQVADNLSNMRADFLAPRHVHSGKVGQWQEELTVEQIREVQRIAGEWFFKRHGYELF